MPNSVAKILENAREIGKARKNKERKEKRAKRAAESTEERNNRQRQNHEQKKVRYSSLTLEQKKDQSTKRRQSRCSKAAYIRSKTAKIACSVDVETFEELSIPLHDLGFASDCCKFCSALRYPTELDSFCCRRGNVQLAETKKPPAVISNLYSNPSFLKNIVGYNNLMALASLGCQEPQ